MNGYHFIADNNLATNYNACISSLWRIFALRQCLKGGCRFGNVIPGCAFPQVSATKTSPAILPCSATRCCYKLFSPLKCFWFYHKFLVAFSRAGVLGLSCDESLVFVLTGGNKWPLVFPRLVATKWSLSLMCVCLVYCCWGCKFTIRNNKISVDSLLQLSPIRISNKERKGFVGFFLNSYVS